LRASSPGDGAGTLRWTPAEPSGRSRVTRSRTTRAPRRATRRRTACAWTRRSTRWSSRPAAPPRIATWSRRTRRSTRFAVVRDGGTVVLVAACGRRRRQHELVEGLALGPPSAIEAELRRDFRVGLHTALALAEKTRRLRVLALTGLPDELLAVARIERRRGRSTRRRGRSPRWAVPGRAGPSRPAADRSFYEVVPAEWRADAARAMQDAARMASPADGTAVRDHSRLAAGFSVVASPSREYALSALPGVRRLPGTDANPHTGKQNHEPRRRHAHRPPRRWRARGTDRAPAPPAPKDTTPSRRCRPGAVRSGCPPRRRSAELPPPAAEAPPRRTGPDTGPIPGRSGMGRRPGTSCTRRTARCFKGRALGPLKGRSKRTAFAFYVERFQRLEAKTGELSARSTGAANKGRFSERTARLVEQVQTPTRWATSTPSSRGSRRCRHEVLDFQAAQRARKEELIGVAESLMSQNVLDADRGQDEEAAGAVERRWDRRRVRTTSCCWKRFRGALDTFFQRRDENRTQQSHDAARRAARRRSCACAPRRSSSRASSRRRRTRWKR